MRLIAWAVAVLCCAAGCAGPQDTQSDRRSRPLSDDKQRSQIQGFPRVGMSREHVRTSLGPPDAEPRRFSTTHGHEAEIWVYYTIHKYTIEFQDGVVSKVWDNTLSKPEKTAP